jgi:alanine racemase
VISRGDPARYTSALPLEVTDRCWAEIDLSAFRRNIRLLREHLGRDTAILLPVKSDAYGHGIREIVRAAAEEGIGWYGVASIEEAVSVRTTVGGARVLFLTPPLAELLPLIVEHDVTPVLTTSVTADQLGRIARSRGKQAAVHVEVDTGMGRTGIDWRKAVEEIGSIATYGGIRIEGIMTHFSCADDRSREFSMEQLRRFEQVLDGLPRDLTNNVLIHASNSAAVMQLREARFNLVRPGIWLYGVSPLDRKEPDLDDPEPVLGFQARVLLVKRVEQNAPISYGAKWTAPSARRIATVSAGYRDGVGYALSRGGRVLIRGKSFPVVGSIGRDGDERIDVKEIAGVCSTIPYDVLCSTGMRVSRIYRQEQEVVGMTPSRGTVRRPECTPQGDDSHDGP